MPPGFADNTNGINRALCAEKVEKAGTKAEERKKKLGAGADLHRPDLFYICS